MKTGDLLFVYGTLRRGQSADLSRDAEFIGEDKINGRLYDVSWFPGVKNVNDKGFDPSLPKVIGDVFRVLSDDDARRLDRYEGYPRLYDRVQVKTSEGRLVWVYIYNDERPDDVRIMSGDWLNQDQGAEREYQG